ncbi:MAG TPA: transposase [Pyrinomonadaceae bacterium]|nr:transposase [Pyrinomonadaceae bacterium]
MVVAKFKHTLELCRELYNAGLLERRDAWKLNRIVIDYFSQANQLPEIKKVRADLKFVYAQVLQDVLRRLDNSFKSFFNRVKRKEKSGFPRFKGTNRYNSFCYPQRGFKLCGNKLSLSKIGTVKLWKDRELSGNIKTCEIKCEADGWYVIFNCDSEKEILPKTGKSIGIDLGITYFATLSNGEVIENPRFLRQAEKRLKKAQKSVSRKIKGSNRCKKAVKLLRKIHLKIKRLRNDFFHKITHSLVRQFDEIAVEALQIKNLIKNPFLAKSIFDASWGIFLRILIYKAESAGKRVWKVNPKNSSQICSNCGKKVKKSLKIRIHRCSKCQITLDRDLNAAINIKGRADLLGMLLVGVTDEPSI